MRKKRQIVRQYVTPPVWDGVQHHACMSKEVTEHEEVLPDADSQALRIVGQMATEIGVPFKVYDVSTFAGKLKAKSRGITKTPAVILNGEKIEDISVDLLKSRLHI